MRTTELVARMRLDASQFDKSLKASQAELQTFSRVAGALPGGRNSVFGALATDAANLAPALTSMPLGIAAVGAALTGAGLAARRAGVEFEASLAKITTLGPDATASLDATRQAILDTYTSVPVTGGIADLAEANYLLQSSGRSATEAIEDLDIAAKASVAGYSSVTTAVDGLTTVTAAWKDEQLTTRQASDVLFASVNVGKTTFDQFASGVGLVANLAASAGVRFTEVAAASAVLSNQGIRSTSVFEGLRSAILNIQRPTEDFKKNYGALAGEFTASRLARDGIIKFLQDFNVASNGSGAALRALFTDATGLTTVLGLLQNGGEDAAAALKQMENATGSADRALAAANKTAKAQEQLLRNQISSAWTQFGELLNTKTLPILEAIARAINDITDGAAFAQTDVQKLIAASGSDLRPGTKADGARGFDQARALRGVVTQFRDNPAQFLKSLSRDDLESLGTELVRLRASGRFQQNGRTAITAELINRIVDERLKRDEIAQREQIAAFDAKGTAASTAEAKAKDEEDEEKRLKRAEKAKADAAEADRKAKELERQRARIVEEAAQLTTQLEAKAIEALQGTAGALQYAMEQTLAEGAKRLASGVLSPEASATLTAQLEQFEQLQTEMIEAERAAKATRSAIDAAASKVRGSGLAEDKFSAGAASTERVQSAREILDLQEQELRAQIAATQNVAARKLLEEQLSAILAARGDKSNDPNTLPKPREVQSQIALMGDLAQSIATVGDQLGLLPRQAVDALRGIGALAEQGKNLTAAFKTGSGVGSFGKFAAGIGVAGGIASLASGLFSESPEDKQRREELRSNTEALRTLTQRVGDLSSSRASGATIERVTRGLSTLLPQIGRPIGTIKDLEGLTARASGVTLQELRELASSLNVTLNGSVESLVQLSEALRTADLNAYLGTFAGSLERLNDDIRADGITDPIEILRRRIAVLTDANTGFPALAAALTGIDVTSAEGRGSALERVQALFDQVQSGTLTAGQFGGLSLPDARSQLLDLITSLRDGADASGTGTGGFNESRSITEVTGSRLAGLFSSANQFLSTIASDVAALRSAIVVGPPVLLAPPSVGTLGGASAQVINITIAAINITLTRELLGADSGTAIALGETMARSIGRSLVGEIDTQLRERQLRQRLLTGDARLTR